MEQSKTRWMHLGVFWQGLILHSSESWLQHFKFYNVILNESRTVAQKCTLTHTHTAKKTPSKSLKKHNSMQAKSYWAAHTISWLPFQLLSPAGGTKWAFLFIWDKNQSVPVVLLHYYQFIKNQESSNFSTVS